MIPQAPPSLAQEWKVKPLLEVRERFESRIDRDFDDSVRDRKSSFLTRVRPGVEVSYGRHWKAQLVYQYTHDWSWTPSKNFSAEGKDLLAGNVQYVKDGLKVVVGRQKLVISSERLIGTSDWGNRGRAYDGFYVGGKDWEAFGAKLGLNGISVPDARVAGATKTWAGGQSMLVFKRDKNAAGSENIWTVDHNWKKTLGAFDVDAEGAYQFGKSKGMDQRAWAVHVGVGYRVPKSQARLYLEFNSASGGNDGSTQRTFDQLYSSSHRLYGLMDLQGWRNMNELALTVENKLTKTTTANLQWHAYSLRDPSDAWYADNGQPNRWSGGTFIDPTGSSGRDVGQEITLEFIHRPNPSWNLSAGVGVMLPGRFIENITGARDRQWWFFAQAVFKL